MRLFRLAASCVALLTFALAGCDAADPGASSTLSADVPLASAAAKSDVCHYDADADTYHLINVADAALPAHIAHGDALPREAVPTMEGFVFDETCVPYVPETQEVCLTDTHGSWWDLTEDLATGALSGAIAVVFTSGSASGTSTPPDVLDAAQAGSTLTLTAVNDAPDGCAHFPDSITYTGTRVGNTTAFSGTWVSYCSELVLYTGTWSGTFTEGACELGDPNDRQAPSFLRSGPVGPAAVANE